MVYIVVDQECVDKHEDRLRYLEGIFEWPGSLGLKVLDGIVGYVTDRSASECRNLWDLDVSVVVEFLLEDLHRIAGDLMSRASLDDLEGIWAGVRWAMDHENDQKGLPAPMKQ